MSSPSESERSGEEESELSGWYSAYRLPLWAHRLYHQQFPNQLCRTCAVRAAIQNSQRSFLGAAKAEVEEIAHIYEIQKRAREEAKTILEVEKQRITYFFEHFNDGICYAGTNRVSTKRLARKLAIAKELGYL